MKRSTQTRAESLDLIKARCSTVMEDETSLVVGFDHHGIITCASRGFARAVNQPNDQILGYSLFELIYPPDLAGLLQAMQQVERQRSVRYDLRLKIGDALWQFKWDIRAVYDDQHRTVEYQATGRVVLGDLLTRAQVEDGSLFRKLTDNVPVMIYLISSSKFLYANPTFEKKFGYTHSELLNIDFWELIHPDHREWVKSRALAKLEGQENLVVNREMKGICKEGATIWGDVFVNVIRLNNETVGLVAAYDITERKRLEAELEQAHRELEQRVLERTAELRKANQELTILNNNLDNIIRNMSDGVILYNRGGQAKILNPAFEKTWGLTISNWREYVEINNLQKKVFEEGAALQEEEFMVPTSRGQKHFLAWATPITDDQGKVSRCLVMLRPMEKVHRLINRFTGAKAIYQFEDIITRSPRMNEVLESARRAARTRNIILLEGESGTGKEMFAHAIHNGSERWRGPFVAMNCAAMPRDLIGSEMFGYVEGAFTGAKRGGSPGKFELASGGTLFLDEIGDMPFEQQAILLRVIQEQQLTRIGGNQLIPIDVRIICATNKDLWSAVKDGAFRQDLYYRLNVINIKIPALRERPQDIPLLLEHYLNKTDMLWNQRINIFSLPVMDTLLKYEWPGNVRELQNFVEKLVHAADSHIDLQEWLAAAGFLPRGEAVHSTLAPSAVHVFSTARGQHRLQVAAQERQHIIELMNKYQGNVSKVARDMGMARSTIYKKMNEYLIGE